MLPATRPASAAPRALCASLLALAGLPAPLLAQEPPPAASGDLAVVEYPIPRAGAFPHDPAVGADGMVWYTDQANSYIGRLDPRTGTFTDWATPTPDSGPHGITVAPDGGVWYTANRVGKIGRLDPATGKIREYTLPAEATDPHTPIWVDGTLWFTVQGADLYGRLDPATGKSAVYPVPARPRPALRDRRGARREPVGGPARHQRARPDRPEGRVHDAGAAPARGGPAAAARRRRSWPGVVHRLRS